MNIRTYSERTPWGIEWTAIDDNIYDGTPYVGVGIGPTEEAAIEDLKLSLEDND